MGLFGKIKNKFNNIRTQLKNNLNVVNKFNPYFDNRESFSNLEKIDEYIDSDITQIYNDIKTYKSDKYEKEILRYDSFITKAKKHNKTIINIDKGMQGFDFSSYIKNPNNHTTNELEKYINVVNEINNFSYKPEKYTLFCEEVMEIKNNFELIKEQFNTKNEIDNYLSILLKDKYFDINERNKIIDELYSISTVLDKSTKLYYDFSSFFKIAYLLEDHNDSFVEKHLHDSIFDNINSKSLDLEQRTAILKDEKSSLTIAGAGSGKTLTICGKVKYLLEKEQVNPKDILLLSYSKKSADDLAQKMKLINSELAVGTFHKLGLDILKEIENKTFVVEEQYNAIIETYFREEVKNRPQMLKSILGYFAFYLLPNKHNIKYLTKGEMFEDIKKSDYSTFKTLLDLSLNPDKKETIKKEIVKSFEEMAIANFYFMNGIDYIYENPYEIDVSTHEKRQYTPDFYLKNYKIYHEHYGVDKNGKANQYKGEEAIKYQNGIQWKRETHQTNNTICIETYSYEFDDGTIFTKLKKELISRGVQFKPLSAEEIHNALYSIYEGQNFKSFINLVKSFLSLYKSRYTSNAFFDSLRLSKFENDYERKRANLFIDIVKDVYSYYIDSIRSSGKIDFDDMILKSSASLQLTNKFNYKYIIVDEFQDISYSRLIFLKKLLEKGNAKLFAVGDDWQAIYRFSGCDLNIFLNFEDNFGSSVMNFITSTHRNSQELQDVAGPFIKANPEQYKKTIKSTIHLENPIKIMYYTDDKLSGLYSILQNIYSINPKASVLILGRNNKDIEDFYTTKFYKDKHSKNEIGETIVSTDFPTLKLKYSTVHSSKGLEDEFVIILNANDTRLGFPNKVEDDELLNLVLSSKSNFPYAEERRLWYVALTRTKSYTYILVEKNNPSIFVEEIKHSCDVLNYDIFDNNSNIINCPHCKSGRLVIRTSKQNNDKFYGCSNFPICKYKTSDFKAVSRNIRCKVCNDFLVYRKGRFGSFLGCHNYPRCTYTEEYDKN